MEDNKPRSSGLVAAQRHRRPQRGVSGEGAKAKFNLVADVTVAGTAGADPHPRFLYHGGAVVLDPQVFAVYVGDWIAPASQARAARLNQFLTDLVASSYMNILSQYGCGTAGSFIGAAFVANVNHELQETTIHQLIQAAIDSGTIPEPTNHNSCYVLFLDDATGVKDPGLKIVMCEADSDNAFGYHNVFATVANNPCNYAIIPGLSDTCLDDTCHGSHTCSLRTTQTQEQRQTQVASHEFAEMISNPNGDAWFDDSSGNENGDLCNGMPGTITVAGRTWTVQRMYSKADDVSSKGGSICILPPAKPLPPLLPSVARLAKADGDIGEQVRRIISFFKFGNPGHAGELTDDIKISDLNLTNEDTIALADALTRFAQEDNGQAQINTNDLTQDGVTIGDVIVLVTQQRAVGPLE